MAPKPHVHKYQRVKLGGTKVHVVDGKRILIPGSEYVVFKCMLPTCTTFKVRDLVIGELSLCWKCGEELILDRENTNLKKPTHKWCRKVKVA
jgi:hypothetical protein